MSKNRKQKRAVAIATIIIAILLVLGVVVYVVINKPATEDVDTAHEEPATEQENKNEKDEPSQQSDVTYEDVIAGTGPLSFKYYYDNVYDEDENYYEGNLFSGLESKEYTLPDLVKAFNEIFNDTERYYGDEGVTYVGYSYLDCGNDGNKELALMFICPVVEPNSTLEMILKEMDGQIQVVYTFCTWSRSETRINKFGVISGGGSGGATLHGWDRHIINADGIFVFGYSAEEQSDIEQFASSQGIDATETYNFDDVVCVYSMRTKPYTSGDYEPEYYAYEVYKDYEEELNNPNLYTDSEYQRFMDKFDISFLTMDEFNKLEEKRLAEIGVTEEMKSAPDIEFTELKF